MGIDLWVHVYQIPRSLTIILCMSFRTCHEVVGLEDLMFFFSGTKKEPPLGFSEKPTLEFTDLSPEFENPDRPTHILQFQALHDSFPNGTKWFWFCVIIIQVHVCVCVLVGARGDLPHDRIAGPH